VLAVLTDFVDELREAGLPVSLTEVLDATEALRHVPLADRAALRSALGATLVKSSAHWPAFATAFDVYFSLRPAAPGEDAAEALAGRAPPPGGAELSAAAPSEAGGGQPAPIDGRRLAALVLEALRSGDPAALAAAARLAVALFAGIEPGRPVGTSYYLYRTMRRLGLDDVLGQLLGSPQDTAEHRGAPGGGAELRSLTAPLGALGERLLGDEYRARVEELRRLVESEIRRLLAAERGAGALAKSLRRTLVEDVDFMHATREELVAMRRALWPLTRVLAARLARRRRHRRRGPLDFRATIRRSLSTGGVPVNPRFRSPHPSKPEIVVIADVSGSVAAFARFTLHLVYAIASQFSKVRSFVFIDGIDEVTSIFKSSSSIAEAIERVGAEADVCHLDGHSDYGNALRAFHQRWAREVTSRTNVLILGDARNNYHGAEAWVLDDLARRARRVYWLNPEPRAYWGSGDSIIGVYAPHCDGVFECRNLRQLESFVDELG